MALSLSLPAALGDEALEPVSTFRAGAWTLHVEPDPFRWALHRDGRPLLAERARSAGGSIEVLRDATWRSVTAVQRLASAGEGFHAVTDLGEIEVRMPMSDVVQVRISTAAVAAVSEDFIVQPDEAFFFAGGTPFLVLSSRGYGLLIRGADSTARPARVTARTTSPDTLRLEAEGELLSFELVAGTPSALVARRRAAQGPAERLQAARELEVTSSASLRAAIHEAQASALTGEPAPRLSVAAIQDAALRDRAMQAAVLLNAAPAANELPARWQAIRAALDPAWRATPLCLDFADARGAWMAREEWRLGPDVLVALPAGDAAGQREVFVPPGRWLDAASPGLETIEGPVQVQLRSASGLPIVLVREATRERHAALLSALAAAR